MIPSPLRLRQIHVCVRVGTGWLTVSPPEENVSAVIGGKMSARTRQMYAAKLGLVSMASAVRQDTAEKSSAEKKNLARIFTYLPVRPGRQACIVVGKHDMEAMGILTDILAMASVHGKEAETYIFRGETFLRYEIKPQWLNQVVAAFQKQFTQRQDLEEIFEGKSNG